MQSLSKDILLDLLELVVEKSTLVIMRNRQITSADDFLLSPERMEKCFWRDRPPLKVCRYFVIKKINP